MEFGMPFLIENETLENCIALCSRLGLKFIELGMNFPQCQLHNLDVNTLLKAKKDHGIYFTIHLDEPFNVCDFNPRIRQAYTDTAVEAIRLSKRIGAPIINMHLSKGVYITLPDKKVLLFEQYKDFYLDSLRKFHDVCAKEAADDIKISIENTNGFLQHEREGIELLLESGVFGLTLDIGHSHVIGDTDIPFYQNQNRLLHMHAHDARDNSNHLSFGDGEIDIASRLAWAKEAGARVVLEVKTVSALTETVSKLECYL